MSLRHRIDLVIPGLFGPVPVHPSDLPATPILARLLGRADRYFYPGRDPVSALLDCFGIEPAQGEDLPSAPFCRLADLQGVDSAGYVMHADPVYLRPDRDRLLLFDAQHLGLSCDESDVLIDLFNRHFDQDGLRLEAAAPERWYLHVQRPPHLRTTPLHMTIGRSISGLLPKGEDASIWARFLNEAQMLFHHAETNQVREREGRPTVSAIWPWGGGQLPDAFPTPRYASVFAADALALGLAVATNVQYSPVPENVEALIESVARGSVLVHWDGLWRPVLAADGAGWIAGMRQFESWLGPLLRGWSGLGNARIHIHPCNGECFEVGAWGLHRFWRRPYALGMRLGRAVRA